METIERGFKTSWIQTLIYILGAAISIGVNIGREEKPVKDDGKEEIFRTEIRKEIGAIREDIATLKGELRGKEQRGL